MAMSETKFLPTKVFDDRRDQIIALKISPT